MSPVTQVPEGWSASSDTLFTQVHAAVRDAEPGQAVALLPPVPQPASRLDSALVHGDRLQPLLPPVEVGGQRGGQAQHVGVVPSIGSKHGHGDEVRPFDVRDVGGL
jgi:hypothetical protein